MFHEILNIMVPCLSLAGASVMATFVLALAFVSYLRKNGYLTFVFCAAGIIVLFGIFEALAAFSYLDRQIALTIQIVSSAVIFLLALHRNLANRARCVLPSSSGASGVEKWLQTIASNLSDAVITFSADGELVYTNAEAERLLEAKHRDLIKKSFAEIVWLLDETNKAPVDIELHNILQKGRHVTYTDGYLLVTALGNTRPVTCTITGVKGNGEEDAGIVVVLSDKSFERQAEADLGLEKDYSRTIIEYAPHIVCGLTPDWKIQYANDAAEDVTGCDKRLLVNTDFFESFATNYPPTDRDALQNRLLKEGIKCLETSSRLGGQEKTISWSIVNRYADSELIERLVFGEDITETKLAREKLRSQKEWLEVTLASISDAVIATDVTGCITFINEQAEMLTGWPSEEAEGRHISEVFRLYNAAARHYITDPVENIIGVGISTQPVPDMELENREGVRVAIDHSGAPIVSEQQETYGAVMVFRDVSARKIAEEHLRSAVDQLLELEYIVSESSIVSVVIGDVSTMAVESVSENVTMYGYTPLELQEGRLSVYDVIVEEDHERVVSEVARLSQEHVYESSIEYRIYTKWREVRWIEARIRPLYTPEGELEKLDSILLDVTERKEMEEELRKARDELELRVQERTASLEKANNALMAEIEERQRAEKQTLERLNYETAIAECSRLLLGKHDRDPLENVLDTLRLIWKLGVACIFERQTGNDASGYIARWLSCDEKLDYCRKVIENTPTCFADYGLENWTKELEMGRPVASCTDELQPKAREFFTHIGALSSLLLPLVFDGKLYGFLLFTDSYRKRDWNEQDVGLLQTAATMVSAYIENKKSEEEIIRSEEKHRSLIEQASDGIMTIDQDGYILDVNTAACEMFGYTPDELRKLGVDRLVADSQQDQLQANYGLVQESEHVVQEWLAVAKNGKTFPVEVSAKVLPNGLVQGIVRDVSERKKAEAELKMQTSAINAASDQIMITDPAGRIEFVNPSFEKDTGYTRDEVIGRNPRFLSSGRHEPSFYKELWSTISQGNTWRSEIVNKRKNGELYTEEMTVTPVKNERGEFKHYIAIKRDISEKKSYEEKLDRLAHHDALTGLPNRLLFSDRLTQRLAACERDGTSLAVMFCDLDRFKIINDSLGHNYGDILLQEVADRLMLTLRDVDTIARMGGDEFTIIVSDISDERHITHVAQKVLDSLARPFSVLGQELFVTGSIGVSVYPDNGTDVETLVKNADTAMYMAKDEGRNTFQFYTGSLNEDAMERMTLESALRKAIARDELVVFYQPRVDITTGAITSTEALVRWQHPEFGLIPPGKFIPLAEENGLIVDISEKVLYEACRQTKEWINDGLSPIRVSVNISARQFQEDRLIKKTQEIIKKTSLAPEYIELEITESTLMKQPEEAAKTLHYLKEMGIQVAIDDFGTGYSSLSYLKRFPIDTVKIDQSFVRDITENADDAAIAGAVVAMAHSLQLRVVAEGVETVEQLDFLRSLKCDEMQGYFVSRPVPADKVRDIIVDTNGTIDGQMAA